MQFTTKTEIPDLGQRLPLGARGFSIGSCFAENIVRNLSVSGFGIVSNPFGVLYNPASIAGAFDILAGGREFTTDDLVRRGKLWYSPLFHGSFSSMDPDAAIDGMNRTVKEGREALAVADFVLISFGTPWIYTVSEKFSTEHDNVTTGHTVANCHKFPSDFYHRRRMEVGEIARLFSNLSEGILKGKKVIYTVSPVRYVKDGLHGSNLGKAILHLAVEQICDRNPGSYYFPAYEILTDELRDYRFYGEDMVHPSPVAVDYIWDMFRHCALTPEASAGAGEIEKLSAAMRHRVQSPGSADHLEYLHSILNKTSSLAKKYPDADLSRQTAFFTSEIVKYTGDDGRG